MLTFLAQTPAEILPLINSGGVVAILLFVIYFGITRKWVFGWQYTECRKEMERAREEAAKWETLALKGTRLASGATAALEKERQRK
jgi:hypothetical protein